MTQGPTLEERRAVALMHHGVPPEFANEVEAWALRGRFAERPSQATFGKVLGALAILLPASSAILFLLYLLNRIPAEQAEKTAREQGATFFEALVIFGPSLLFAVGATMCLIGWPLFEDRYDSRHKAAKGLWELPGLPGFYARTIIALVRSGAENADQFLLNFRRFDLKVRATFLAVMLAVIVGVTAGEANSFSVAGPKGLIQQRFWGEATRAFYPITQVTHVRTDCYYESGRGGGWRLVFNLQFRDGQTFNIGKARMLRGDRLAALEAIAAALPSSAAYEPEASIRERIDGCIGTEIDDGPGVRQRLIKLLDPDPPTSSSE